MALQSYLASIIENLSLVHVGGAVLLLLVLQLGFLLVRWRLVKRSVRHIDGLDDGLLGRIPHLIRNKDRIYDFDLECHLKYGITHKSTNPFWVDHVTIATIDPVNIKHVYKTNFRNYVKPTMLRSIIEELIGNGIFRVNHGHDGEYPIWHAQRKTMSKIFFKRNFEQFMQDVFNRHAQVMCEVLRGHAENNTVVDAQSVMFNFTLDSIAEIGFGGNFDSLRKPMKVGTTFDRVTELSFVRLMHPLFNLPIFGKLFYQHEREMPVLIKELDEFALKVIKERRAKILRKGSSFGLKQCKGAAVGQDCLSLFLEDNKLGYEFSDKELRDICMSIMIAGRDTTACTLAFSVATVLERKDLTDKLRQEIATKLQHTVCGEGSQPVCMKDVTARNMPYLHGFIYEMLRLHPPVPTEVKKAVKDDVLPDGTFVAAGTDVVTTISGMCRYPDFWEDPEKVIPERWENTTRSAFEFPVFQAGPRICLGMNMALLESKIALVYLLSSFELTPTKECRIPAHYMSRITQSVKDGLPVRVAVRH